MPKEQRWPSVRLKDLCSDVEHINRASADIEVATSQARRQIDLMNEYRTRIIADVVTGQLDVRDAAAQLREAP